MPLNNEPYIIRPAFIDLNPVDPKYYQFMSSLDKYSGGCNSADVLPTNICVRSKKDINVKVFKMRANKNEAKAMVKQCNFKFKFNSPTRNSNQNWNYETCE